MSVPPAQPLLNRKKLVDWLGVSPFVLFATMFLIAPTLYLVTGAFLNADGQLTLENIAGLFTPKILASYSISLKISLASAFGGTLIGFFLAWAFAFQALWASS